MNDQEMGEEVVEQTTQANPEAEAEVQEPGQVEEEAQTVETETTQNNEAEEPPKENAAWAKMRVENKQLKQIAEAVTHDSEYFKKLQEANQYQPYVPDIQPITEEADYGQTINAVNQAQRIAQQANYQLAQMRQEILKQQEREAYQRFPELKTDQVFNQLVAERKLVATQLGQPMTTVEAAEMVKGDLERYAKQYSAKAEEQTKQRMAEKKIAIAEPKSTTTAGASSTADDELSYRARRGDRTAQVEKAKRLLEGLDF